MSELVHGLDERASGEEFRSGCLVVELRSQSGQANQCATARNECLPEDEVQVRCVDIRIDDSEDVGAGTLTLDQFVEDGTSPELIAGRIEPIGVDIDRCADGDGGREPLLQPGGEVLQDGVFD